MAEIGLGQPVFIYSACGPFVKSKKGILKLKETRDSRYIIKIKLPFNLIWLVEILRICLEKRFLINYYVIKHLIRPKL